MAYQLEEINRAVRQDKLGFMQACDAEYQKKVEQAADLICKNMKLSPVVLLSGPSGSGKTTTAHKITAELQRRGVGTHTISMDDYFVRRDPSTAPRTPEGEIDYESPEMMDLQLLSQHFAQLTRGEEILVPHFEFARQMRNDSKAKPLKLGKDEVAIFEGIHALNTKLTAGHPNATRLYISARSNVMDGEVLRFKGTWMRLTRRAVRDFNFRGTDIVGTLDMWANVRRGEKLYISPYKHTAHMLFDSSLPYEVSVMACYARPLMAAVPQENQRRHELLELVRAFDWFETIEPGLVPKDSLLHEFIG
ncbi:MULTISPECIES: nucleoside kinase [unclassified Pseudoflavonifractor]|uniref:uridine kinase family protein n=1 Tax=unclassified Pseudoflavonifractor TaxID=2628103 RepID=UPI000B37FBF4|nr:MULTISPECIES: nucleoside kinase [unclassified Pseudoflavonifractor]OUP41770.1 nucleoside kinase [Pseudoflavonifractor sp. An187]OUP63264.1 nucleoside kinase [Pseudoflavonifractor sp. An176]